MTEKHCIICGEAGHTYLECPKANFFDLFVRSVGGEPIAPTQTREEMVKNLREIEDKRNEESA